MFEKIVLLGIPHLLHLQSLIKNVLGVVLGGVTAEWVALVQWLVLDVGLTSFILLD